MATNFIIQQSIQRGGVFPQEDVPTLCYLASWSENSGAWQLYVKENGTPLKSLWDAFHSVVICGGFNEKMVTHHCNCAGMATNFIIIRSIERGGVFPQEDVPTLCRLAGWSETSGAWRLYVKDVFESNIDSSGLIYSDLRIPERVKYLKNITSHYNFRLLAPEKNLETLQDCLDIAPKEWTEFCKSINKNCLNITFSDLENDNKHLEPRETYQSKPFCTPLNIMEYPSKTGQCVGHEQLQRFMYIPAREPLMGPDNCQFQECECVQQ